jgi:peptide/nickel transport system substrate-binding protein
MFVLSIALSVSMSANVGLAAPQGTLRVALSTMPNAIEPAVADERNATNVASQLFDSLVWTDDNGKVVPALAESWTISKDGTEYTFKLRKGVTFHNGEPFTADSVIYSWKRGKKKGMKWADRFNIVKSMEKVDDYTVKASCGDKPNPLLLRYISNDWGMIPPKYHQKVGENGFLLHPVGTGPFMFKEWKKGDRLVFEANPNYWEKGYPKVQTLIFRPIPESSTRVAAIKTGEVDIVGRLSAEEAGSLKGLPSVKPFSYNVDRVYYIAFNNLTSGKGLPTESPLVRRAMNYAVDVQAILDALFNGNGRQATGFVTPGNIGYDKEIKPFGFDPEKAKALLKEAGYAKGFDIDFACPAGAYTNFEQVCEAVQGFLSDVGINTNLSIMESGKYWDLEAKKQLPPLFGDSWSERAGEALPRLKGALGGMDASYSAWSDPEIDRLMSKISVTVDEAARAALYVEIQRYMQKNPPFIYLYEPVTFEAISTKVRDYRPRAAESYYLKYTYVQ